MSNFVVNVYSFVFAIVLADSSAGSKADKLPSLPIPPFLQDFFSSNPIFAWIFWIFTACAIGVTAFATFTGKLKVITENLQAVHDLLRKHFAQMPLD